MAVGHEWDMRSEVHYLRYVEKCPDRLGDFSKHILQEQNFSMVLQYSNTSYARHPSNNCILCLNSGN